MEFLSIAVITLFLVHELDAIKTGEYKMFPVISKLPNEQAYFVFTVLHIPLVFVILLLMTSAYSLYLYIFMDVFALIHVGLHLLLKDHPENGFDSLFSNALIFSTGGLGAIDLLIRFIS